MTAPSPISAKDIAATLVPFGICLSEEQLAAVQKYVALLLVWNQKVSLTAIEDPREIVSRHFAESMFAAKMLGPSTCRLADVGTGAGFPGLPLKIAAPTLQVVLIEPNLKKCAFLTEVVAALELKDVEVFRGQYSAFREEEIAQSPAQGRKRPEGFDVVCSRALGDYKPLVQWAKRALRPEGRAFLWLGEADANLLGKVKGWTWDPPIRLPESSKRVIFAGRPTS